MTAAKAIRAVRKTSASDMRFLSDIAGLAEDDTQTKVHGMDRSYSRSA